jgi:hypothetical protein
MYKETIQGLKEKTQAKIAGVDAQKADLEGDMAQMNTLETEVTNYGEERYNAGWNEAIAQKGLEGEKIFSNEEYDKGIADAVAPLNEKISAQASTIADLEAKVAMAAEAQATALKEQRLAIAAKVEAVEVDNKLLVDELKAE